MTPEPNVNAMLICDHVIVDKFTGKKSLIGIFENINSPIFPVAHPTLSIYISLTDAQGKYKIGLKVVDLETDKQVGGADIPEIEVHDRLATSEVIMNMRGIRFAHPGKYVFNIYANDYPVGSKTFSVVKVEGGKPNE